MSGPGSDLTHPRSSRASLERRPLTQTRRNSDDSIDSLRNLELSDGPAASSERPRSISFSGFDFQRDLLPLSASLSEADSARGEAVEKSIGLIQGIGLIVGLQIGSGIL